MFKENRKLVDSWTFDWFNQRTGQQLIRMKLYECSGFLATSKYVIEFENKCGFVFHSENYVSVSDSLLMGYFFEIHMAIIMDKYILGEDEGFCFNQIKKADFEVMNSLYWSEFSNSYIFFPFSLSRKADLLLIFRFIKSVPFCPHAVILSALIISCCLFSQSYSP